MNALHGATGIPLPTIVDLDRRLVKGGLRTKAGRGLSAAQMTPLDAARLLTALLASGHANVAVEAVNRYAQTRCDRDRSSPDLFKAAQFEELSSLPADHSFVDALVALIAATSTGSLAHLLDDEKGSTPHIEIFALTRATRGRIRISGLATGLTVSMEYVPRASAPLKKARRTSGLDAVQSIGDLEQSRRITERTLFPVAQILA